MSVQNTPNSLQLYDIYNPGYVQGGNLTMKYFGTWINGKFMELLQFSKYFQRIDFKEITLKAATVVSLDTDLILTQTKVYCFSTLLIFNDLLISR